MYMVKQFCYFTNSLSQVASYKIYKIANMRSILYFNILLLLSAWHMICAPGYGFSFSSAVIRVLIRSNILM